MVPNNGYKHIIWDWNGTLLDDIDLSVGLINDLLGERDRPLLTLSTYRDIFNFPVVDFYRKAGFDFDKEQFACVALDFCNRYEERLDECKLQSGAIEILDYCCGVGIGQSVLSSTEQGILNGMIAYYGVEKYFDHVIGQTNHHANGKLGSGNNLLERTKLALVDVLLVGDTTYDAYVAQTLKIDSVLVSTGHQSVGLLTASSSPTIHRLLDLRPLIEARDSPSDI
jgi:phosphoglycolate phosphatase